MHTKTLSLLFILFDVCKYVIVVIFCVPIFSVKCSHSFPWHNFSVNIFIIPKKYVTSISIQFHSLSLQSVIIEDALFKLFDVVVIIVTR